MYTIQCLLSTLHIILLHKQGERNGTFPLDSDSHMFVNMGVGDLKKMLTKCFYVKQINSGNCCIRIN